MSESRKSLPSDRGDVTDVVESAWQDLCERDDRTSPEDYPDMCLITREELAEFMSRARLSQAGARGVVVKPLEWRHFDNGDAWAQTGCGLCYFARRDGSWAHRNGDFVTVGTTLDEAKAAAQADYEARILAALAPSPSAGEPEERVLARVASIICEETCGLTSECRSREAAKALLDKGYLTTPPATPVQPTASVEAVAWRAVSDFVDEMLRDWSGGDDCRISFGLQGATVTKGQFRAVQAALASLTPAILTWEPGR